MNFETIEKTLFVIINEITSIPKVDHEFINELINHSEYGVALELLCEVIKQEKLIISYFIYDKLVELSKAINMDEKIWIGLDEFVIE